MNRLFPASLWLPTVTRKSLAADAWAAVTSAVLVLPQAIAFSAIAGLPIEFGFYTAMVTPVIAALFGSSLHMVSGPTTALSVLLFAALSQRFEAGSPEFIEAALTLTLLAGVFQIVMGLLRLGNLSSFVSPSVMVGFTAGAAAIIALSQVPGLLGLSAEALRAELLGPEILRLPAHSNYYTMAIAGVSIAVALGITRYAPRLPSYLGALLAGTLLAWFLDAGEHGVGFVSLATGADFSVIPPFAWPEISLEYRVDLAQSALALALVGLLEAGAISRSLAIKTGQDININQEFIGQGLSNTVASCFSAYMGSGSFTRSAANLAAGAITPLSAVFSSLVLFLILVFFHQWVALIPTPAISGIILVVAFRLIEVEAIGHIARTSRASTLVMGVTFFTTLVVGLEFGIYVGVFVSLMSFLRRSANPYLAMIAPDSSTGLRYFKNAPAFGLNECPQLGIGRLDGVLYFGSIDEFRRQLRRLEIERPEQTHLLLLMKGVGDIDMPGAELIIEEAGRRLERGGRLYLTARERQINGLFLRYNVIDALGEDQVFATKRKAIETIVSRLDEDICERCDKRIFKECPGRDPARGATQE
jgi:SulP family sulfate permease